MKKINEKKAHDENSLDVWDQELWLLEPLLWRLPPETCHILRQEVSPSVELIRAHFAQKRALLHDGNAQRDFGAQLQIGSGGCRGAWFNSGHGGGCRGRAGSYTSLTWHGWVNFREKKKKRRRRKRIGRCGMRWSFLEPIPHVNTQDWTGYRTSVGKSATLITPKLLQVSHWRKLRVGFWFFFFFLFLFFLHFLIILDTFLGPPRLEKINKLRHNNTATGIPRQIPVLSGLRCFWGNILYGWCWSSPRVFQVVFFFFSSSFLSLLLLFLTTQSTHTQDVQGFFPRWCPDCHLHGILLFFFSLHFEFQKKKIKKGTWNDIKK